MAKRAKAAAHASQSAVLRGPPVRLRSAGFTMIVDESAKPPSMAELRKGLRAAGLPTDLLDAPTIRRMHRATAALTAEALEDDAVLVRLARNPVAAYRSVDADLADRLAAVDAALKQATTEPPDIGELRANRRVARLARPVVRSAALDDAVARALAELTSWATADPDRIADLRQRPATTVDAAAPDLAPAVRRRLLARLSTTPATPTTPTAER